MQQPDIKVGIMTAPSLTLVFHGSYTCHGELVPENVPVTLAVAEIADGTEYVPADLETCDFEVIDVVIGVNFHWERRENQRFRGSARMLVGDEGITLVNILPVEDYLLSVISSEMSADAPEEFLKAHAVISRSWLLAQIQGRDVAATVDYCSDTVTETEVVRWYDHTDHDRYDVCADDHCQRYQGIMRQTTETVRRAVRLTAGRVLMADGQLVDARFSKCCGGVFEEFENCWQPVHHNYLVARADTSEPLKFPDLYGEDAARWWILSRPDAFCAAPSRQLLDKVLNGYDRETSDFYRWTVEYTRSELSALLRRRSGIDFGDIIELEPLTRGTSGRIVRLRITGTRRTIVVGKELEIRRWLSPSHLYSSAFVVDHLDRDDSGVPARIVLRGAGWGHGVGLCQIGAAVMSDRGYTYDAILSHYFPGSALQQIY